MKGYVAEVTPAWTCTMTMEWEREERSFMAVAPTARAASPSRITRPTSAADATTRVTASGVFCPAFPGAQGRPDIARHVMGCHLTEYARGRAGVGRHLIGCRLTQYAWGRASIAQRGIGCRLTQYAGGRAGIARHVKGCRLTQYAGGRSGIARRVIGIH